MLLTGCGFIMPNDSGFIAVVTELDTPKKICQYMSDNFTYEHIEGLITPYELYITKEGNCNDFAYFGRWVARRHDYETYWIRIYFTTGMTRHIIQIYVEGKYNYSSNTNYYPTQADSYREIVTHYFNSSNKELLEYNVYDYNNKLIEKGTNE